MSPSLQDRVAYGRSIRDRAAALREAHGLAAAGQALTASREPGTTPAEQRFWEAVAARLTRLEDTSAAI